MRLVRTSSKELFLLRVRILADGLFPVQALRSARI